MPFEPGQEHSQGEAGRRQEELRPGNAQPREYRGPGQAVPQHQQDLQPRQRRQGRVRVPGQTGLLEADRPAAVGGELQQLAQGHGLVRQRGQIPPAALPAGQLQQGQQGGLGPAGLLE